MRMTFQSFSTDNPDFCQFLQVLVESTSLDRRFSFAFKILLRICYCVFKSHKFKPYSFEHVEEHQEFNMWQDPKNLKV